MEEGWESAALEVGDIRMESGALSSNKVILSMETVWDQNANAEKTDMIKKTSKKERQWIRSQKFIKKQSDGEIMA